MGGIFTPVDGKTWDDTSAGAGIETFSLVEANSGTGLLNLKRELSDLRNLEPWKLCLLWMYLIYRISYYVGKQAYLAQLCPVEAPLRDQMNGTPSQEFLLG